MSLVQTVSATEFKAKCLDLPDRASDRQITQLQITRLGRVVAVVTPPPIATDALNRVHGCLKGSVLVPDTIDLTDAVLDDPLAAQEGTLHA